MGKPLQSGLAVLAATLVFVLLTRNLLPDNTVTETQSLVSEYQAQIAELKATTTSPIPEELPAGDQMVDECQPGQVRPDDDPPIGSPSPSGEPLQAVEMRLRSGSRSDLLVPESWVLLSDDCTFNGERIWVNPLDDRERVAHAREVRPFKGRTR